MIAFITMINGWSILLSYIIWLAPLGRFLLRSGREHTGKAFCKKEPRINILWTSIYFLTSFCFPISSHNRDTDIFWRLDGDSLVCCAVCLVFFFPHNPPTTQNNNNGAGGRMPLGLWWKAGEKSFSHSWQPLWCIQLIAWKESSQQNLLHPHTAIEGWPCRVEPATMIVFSSPSKLTFGFSHAVTQFFF